MATGTFQDELRKLRNHLSQASDLIDSLQRFGLSSSTIRSLQSSLSNNIGAIDVAFNRYKANYGTAFVNGDSIAANAINKCNMEMHQAAQNSYRLKPRVELEKLEGSSNGRALEDWNNGIEKDVIAAFEALARRLDGGGSGGWGGGGGGTESGRRGLLSQLPNMGGWLGGSRTRNSNGGGSDGDYSDASGQDLSLMIQHLRDSWMVENVDGRTVYVNVYEPSLRRSDRPRSGFIQVESDRNPGLGYGGLRGRFYGIEGLGRGPLGMASGSRNTGSIFDR